MNRYLKMICIAVILSCVLSSCSQGENGIDTDTSASDFDYHFSFLELSEEKRNILEQNPIDAQYTQDEMPYATMDIVRHEKKYVEFWNVEIENALSILRENLSQETFSYIEAAQENWQAYMSNEIPTIRGVQTETDGTGTIIYILESEKSLNYTRQRALELIEYCVKVTGTYDFVYVP